MILFYEPRRAVCSFLLLLFIPGLAQSQLSYQTPRNEFGQPDLQGTWYFGSTTPFERPQELGTKKIYTEAEVREFEERLQSRRQERDQALSPDRGAPDAGAFIGQEADGNFVTLRENLVPVNGEYRTSIIIDPTNGRIPFKEDFVDFYASVEETGLVPTDGPEGQPISGRCLIFGGPAPSLRPIAFNSNMQIVQTEDYVVILTEMIHDARIIRLDGSHHDNGTRFWTGDSIGYFEDDTLIVITKDFRLEHTGRRFAVSEEFELTERFTRTADDEILYSFTISDEQAYTQPFTGERMVTRREPGEHLYEFACHEGNYSLPGILAGARRADIFAGE